MPIERLPCCGYTVNMSQKSAVLTVDTRICISYTVSQLRFIEFLLSARRLGPTLETEVRNILSALRIPTVWYPKLARIVPLCGTADSGPFPVGHYTLVTKSSQKPWSADVSWLTLCAFPFVSKTILIDGCIPIVDQKNRRVQLLVLSIKGQWDMKATGTLGKNCSSWSLRTLGLQVIQYRGFPGPYILTEGCWPWCLAFVMGMVKALADLEVALEPVRWVLTHPECMAAWRTYQWASHTS